MANVASPETTLSLSSDTSSDGDLKNAVRASATNLKELRRIKNRLAARRCRKRRLQLQKNLEKANSTVSKELAELRKSYDVMEAKNKLLEQVACQSPRTNDNSIIGMNSGDAGHLREDAILKMNTLKKQYVELHRSYAQLHRSYEAMLAKNKTYENMVSQLLQLGTTNLNSIKTGNIDIPGSSYDIMVVDLDSDSATEGTTVPVTSGCSKDVHTLPSETTVAASVPVALRSSYEAMEEKNKKLQILVQQLIKMCRKDSMSNKRATCENDSNKRATCENDSNPQDFVNETNTDSNRGVANGRVCSCGGEALRGLPLEKGIESTESNSVLGLLQKEYRELEIKLDLAINENSHLHGWTHSIMGQLVEWMQTMLSAFPGTLDHLSMPSSIELIWPSTTSGTTPNLAMVRQKLHEIWSSLTKKYETLEYLVKRTIASLVQNMKTWWEELKPSLRTPVHPLVETIIQ